MGEGEGRWCLGATRTGGIMKEMGPSIVPTSHRALAEMMKAFALLAPIAAQAMHTDWDLMPEMGTKWGRTFDADGPVPEFHYPQTFPAVELSKSSA